MISTLSFNVEEFVRSSAARGRWTARELSYVENFAPTALRFFGICRSPEDGLGTLAPIWAAGSVRPPPPRADSASRQVFRLLVHQDIRSSSRATCKGVVVVTAAFTRLTEDRSHQKRPSSAGAAIAAERCRWIAAVHLLRFSFGSHISLALAAVLGRSPARSSGRGGKTLGPRISVFRPSAHMQSMLSRMASASRRRRSEPPEQADCPGSAFAPGDGPGFSEDWLISVRQHASGGASILDAPASFSTKVALPASPATRDAWGGPVLLLSEIARLFRRCRGRNGAARCGLPSLAR